MLEILFLIYLCKKNAENAVMHGRKPAGFVVLTIVLWLGMEFLGAFIGIMAGESIGAYLLGLMMAALGGFISCQIAKNCKYKNETLPVYE